MKGCPCCETCCANPKVFNPMHKCASDSCEECYKQYCENCEESCYCDL